MDANPYESPQADGTKDLLKRRARPSTTRGAIIGAIIGGLPVPLISIGFVAWHGLWNHYWMSDILADAMGWGFVFGLLGSAMGAAIIALAKRAQWP